MGKEVGSGLETLAYHEFHYYASGRVNLEFALFKIELERRFCIFSSTIGNLISPSYDMVTIEIPLNVKEYTLPDGTSTNAIPLEFAVCKKKNLKALFNNNPYMKNFISPIQPKNLKQDLSSSASLIVLGESEEAVNHLIDGGIGEVLSNLGEDHVHEIRITD